MSIELKLTEDCQQFQALARDFAANEIAPVALKLDDENGFPEEICRQAWQMGLMNTIVPEEFGGLGLGLLDACVIQEEIAAACPGVATLFATNLQTTAILLSSESDHQRSEVLQKLTADHTWAVSCLYRRISPSLPLPRAVATDYGWELTGEALAFAGARAAYLVVFAGNGPTPDQASAFLVRVSDCRDSLRLSASRSLPGLGCAGLTKISFEGVRLGREALLSAPGGGRELLRKSSRVFHPIWASQAVGVTRACLRHSIAYSKERHAFGQPIATYQAVSFMLADMARNAEAARLMTWRAASEASHGRPNDNELNSAVAFALDSAMEAATDAVQIFGGYGYSKEYPVEKLMRDAKSMQIAGDTSFDARVEIGLELLRAGR